LPFANPGTIRREETGPEALPRENAMRRFSLAISILVAALPCLAMPAAPEEPVMPPTSARKVLEVAADGVQIYVCEGKEQTYSWSFRGPEAALFDAQGRQVGEHGAGPSWKLADGSYAIGEKVAQSPSPKADAIPWLLLKVKSHEGKGKLDAVSWVRRSDTRGGVAPTGGCDAGHLGEAARMRYSATYQFFGP